MDRNGIQLANSDLRKWSEINGEEVNWIKKDKMFGGKSTYSTGFLVFNFYNERIEFEIDDLETTQEELEKLMKIYRGRSENRMRR